MEVSTRTYCLSIQPSLSMKRPRAQDWPRAHMQVPHPHPGHPCACAQAQAPHFLPIFSYSCPGQLMQAQDFLFPPPLPSPPSSQPAPPLRKYSSGVPRAAQEMLYTPRVSQAIFCPRTRGRLGWEQPVTTQLALLSLFLRGFFFGSTVWCFSVSLLSLYFSFGPTVFGFLSLGDCLHTLQNSAQCYLFQKAFPEPSCPIRAPLPFAPRALSRVLSEPCTVWMNGSLPLGQMVKHESLGCSGVSPLVEGYILG